MKHLLIVFAMGTRNLLSNGRRTISTLIAISVGLLGLTLLDGFITYSMNGFRDAIIKSGTGDIQVAQSSSYFDEGDSNPFPFMLKNVTGIDKQLRAFPEVIDVVPSLAFSAVIVAGGKTSTVQVSALPVEQAHANLSARDIVSGRDLLVGSEGDIIVGKGVAMRLGLRPGDNVSLFALQSGGGINTEIFAIVGTTSSGIAAVDNVSVFMSLADAQTLVGASTVPDLIVFFKKAENTASIIRAISLVPATSALSGLTSRSWEQLSPDYQQANSFYQMILGVARLIVLLVALLSISGSVSLSVVERYREIGTLRAFGTKRPQLLLMFIVESFLLGAAGAIAGCLLGSGMSALINALGGITMQAEPGMSTASLAVRFTPNIANFMENGAWVILAAVAGAVLPWVRSNRLTIITLLRSKK